ncbi:MAG: FKBP-type peptidyl-prolyl cis-trans isomerase [Prevotellaceae bacterium]|jgi:FKBP-type peptidyl-prolyl cis-trans isomerase|nr:FKBP-type peptidyl-prolyl cis-trans isomerase [Prevotellaceae bacterium]
MKKIYIFIAVLAGIMAVSSCQSRLGSSSSELDSISYSVGVMWGQQLLMDGLQSVNINEAIKALKHKIKEPVTAENNIYTLSMQFREFLQKSPQRVYSKQEKQYLTNMVGAIWSHQLSETNIFKLNLKYTKQGIKDILKNDTTTLQMTLVQANSYIIGYRQRLEKRENEKRLTEGREFLEKNKNEDGVITTESGLQYKVIIEGNNMKATENDSAYLDITITQINGDTIEDSKNKAYYVYENRLIKGLFEGLQLFGEGSKFILYIPSELAFGNSIDPWITSKIKPNMVLIYNVEIKKIINNNINNSKSKRK